MPRETQEMPYACLTTARAREASRGFLERTVEACAPATAAHQLAKAELRQRKADWLMLDLLLRGALYAVLLLGWLYRGAPH